MDFRFALPELGEGILSGDVVNVLVKEGDTVIADQTLMELETDKAVIEVPSPVAGVVKEVRVQKGGKAMVGEVVCVFDTNSLLTGEVKEAPEPKKEAAPAPKKEEPPKPKKEDAPLSPTPKYESVKVEAVQEGESEIVPAAPSVRRFARELGVDIALVPGSGEGGRITVEDVKTFLKTRPQTDSREPASIQYAELPDFSKWGEITREPMSNVRRRTAENLSMSWTTGPQVTQFDKCDITELEALRKLYGKRAEAAGGKLTMTALLVKVCERALKKFPQFNASIDMAANEIITKKYYNIGVAAETERGLLVPVVKNADRKNIIEIAVELTELTAKARNRKLSLEEMAGSCFTISNLGGIGGMYFTPIVNQPDVAILGVSRAAMEPKWNGKEFVPRLMMPLALSYDHRLIDGADGARFMRWLCEALEEPFLMSLEG